MDRLGASLWSGLCVLLVLPWAWAIGGASEARAQVLSAAGTPTIDGVKSPGEWDGAASRSVFSSFPGSTLYVMNDDQNLYLGIEVLGDTDLTGTDAVSALFDNDRDLVFTQYDDQVRLRTGDYLDLHYETGTGFGVVDPLQNGGGAVGRAGGANFFEISKPLNVGDPRDFALVTGDRVGICLLYRNNGSGSSPGGDHPSGCLTAPDQQGYDVIEIVFVPIQPISAYGAALVDGTKGPGEWDAAAVRPILRDLPGSTLYMMNDDQNLYLGIEVLGDLDLTATDRAEVRFDNERDLMTGDGDDEVRLGTGGYSDLHYASGWGAIDSLQHGNGAVARAGGVNFFEISKPLDSGDAQDFSRAPGEQLGFCIIYFEDNTATSRTSHPTSCASAGQPSYDIFEIASQPEAVPAVSAPGAAAVALLLLAGGLFALGVAARP
jgi:hypothetical protein